MVLISYLMEVRSIPQPGIIASLTYRWEKLLCRSRLFSLLYSLPYRKVVRRELRLAGVSDGDRILNIGCGAVPFSAMYAAQLSRAEVLAIERQPDAAKLARQCVRIWGLTDRVQVVTADAVHWVPPDFTAALVALQAEPKTGIFERLSETAKPGARLIFREPSGGFAGQYDSISEIYPPNRSIKQDMITFDRSLLYEIPQRTEREGK